MKSVHAPLPSLPSIPSLNAQMTVDILMNLVCHYSQFLYTQLEPLEPIMLPVWLAGPFRTVTFWQSISDLSAVNIGSKWWDVRLCTLHIRCMLSHYL
jgi:hypothetical protein